MDVLVWVNFYQVYLLKLYDTFELNIVKVDYMFDLHLIKVFINYVKSTLKF